MSQMTPEVAKLLEQALNLSVEEQEALADSLISNLGGKSRRGRFGCVGRFLISSKGGARPNVRTLKRAKAACFSGA